MFDGNCFSLSFISGWCFKGFTCDLFIIFSRKMVSGRRRPLEFQVWWFIMSQDFTQIVLCQPCPFEGIPRLSRRNWMELNVALRNVCLMFLKDLRCLHETLKNYHNLSDPKSQKEMLGGCWWHVWFFVAHKKVKKKHLNNIPCGYLT